MLKNVIKRALIVPSLLVVMTVVCGGILAFYNDTAVHAQEPGTVDISGSSNSSGQTGADTAAPQKTKVETVRYGGLVKCDGVVDVDPKTKKPLNNGQVKCDFNALVYGIKSILKWLIGMGITIAIVLFAWAGILYMTGKPNNISKAKSIFPTVAKGFIIMLVAWVLIYSLLKIMMDQMILKSEYFNVGTTLLKGDF